jgi:hypothetical protein
VLVLPDIILFDVIGSPIRTRTFYLVPALFEFDFGTEGQAEYPLIDFKTELHPTPSMFTSEELDNETLLTYWVRARIPSVFGFSPIGGWDLPSEDFLDLGFLAVRNDTSMTPFRCIDRGFGPVLKFRKTETKTIFKQSIAEAFWNLLLQDLFDLLPFEIRMEEELGGWSKVEFSHDRFFGSDIGEIEDEKDAYDSHTVWLSGEVFCCPDCDGTGIDDFYPFTEDCGLCGGTGGVTW